MKTKYTHPLAWQYPRLCIVVLIYLVLGQLAGGNESNIDSTASVSQTSSVELCTELGDENCSNSTEAAEEVQCNNADGWNLRGSEWGCCGNYDGCCTYASFICYLHDAMCKCCDVGGQLCGPKCKPEPECSTSKQEQVVKEDIVDDKLSDIDSDHLDIEDLEQTVPELLQNNEAGIEDMDDLEKTVPELLQNDDAGVEEIEDIEKTVPESLQNDEAGIEAQKAVGMFDASQNDNHTNSTNTGTIKTQGYINDSAYWFAHSNDTSKEADEYEDEGSGESSEKVHI